MNCDNDEPSSKKCCVRKERIDDLFSDIGFPEEIGLAPFHDSVCPSEDLFKENTKYFDEAETWFTKPIEGEGGSIDPPPPPPTPPPAGLFQYTPEFSRYGVSGTSMMNTSTAISQAVATVSGQDPDGIGWITPSQWTAAEWDGVPLNTAGKTKEEICAFLRPAGTPWVLRGIRERFYEVNPFADNTSPTIAEIDNWNLEVIRHIRALLGVSVPVNHNAKLYMEARWADERKKTIVWDGDYSTGTPGTAPGPCWNPPGSATPIDTAGGHCGASFFPNPPDRAIQIANAPYLGDFVSYPELTNYGVAGGRYSLAEGLSSTNVDIPWSIKLARIISGWICGEGLTGHAGPYVGTSARTEFGSSWWYISGTQIGYRGKLR